jgi:hypothetical protein
VCSTESSGVSHIAAIDGTRVAHRLGLTLGDLVQALLWESRKDHALFLQEPPASWQAFLPQGSSNVKSRSYAAVIGPGAHLSAGVGFYVRPAGGEGGGDPLHRPYCLAGGDAANYEAHPSFCYLVFNKAEVLDVADFVRRVLVA